MDHQRRAPVRPRSTSPQGLARRWGNRAWSGPSAWSTDPKTERASRDFRARLTERFDPVIHLDRTRAVDPLERTAAWGRDEVPETFPSGV